MKDRPYLRALADRLGILAEYFDVTGATHVTPDTTRVAILAAMGFDASTETVAALTLAEFEQSLRERLMPPVCVTPRSQSTPPQVRLHTSWLDRAPVDWHIELAVEGGGQREFEGRSEPDDGDGTFCAALPADLEPGYHEIHAVVRRAGSTVEGRQSFILTPDACTSVPDRVGDRRLCGLWANLYSIKSSRNWGIGDLSDLAALATGAARYGASFVGVNPLHAVANEGDRVGPYCPVSRLFRSLAYIDIEAVPEFATCCQSRALYESSDLQNRLARARDSKHVEYEQIAGLKTAVLRLLHQAFAAGATGERRSEYDRFIERAGRALDDYATYRALGDWIHETEQGARDWRTWPAGYRSCSAPAVDAFRSEQRDRIDFYRFVQFELDRQLGAAATAGRDAGMALGLYQDLAVGSAADGSDAWSFDNLFLDGLEVGAPPDPYCEAGQTWGFPPVDPKRLQDSGYDYWIQLLRANMRHAGMLRIDHVMGLYRQFWVPEGCSAAEGAYVRYPAEDLLGILALESRRHEAVVVGEDLGTVPPELPDMLEKWGVHSSRVFYFERDAERYHPPQNYKHRALVTATTHDHVPLTGHWVGRDLELRRGVGLFDSEVAWDEAVGQRERDRRAMIAALVTEGLAPEEVEQSPARLCAAVYEFLARTPSLLIGLSFDDLAGEIDPVNLPGVGPQRYRSWSRKMTARLDEILSDPQVRRLIECVAERLSHPH